MTSHSFLCPHCSARLRIRDRSFVGRLIDCPDCREPLFLEDASGLGIIARPAQLSASARRETTRRSRGFSWNIPRRLTKLLVAASSPVGVSWIAAAAFSMALLIWLLTSPAPQERALSAQSVKEPAAGVSKPAPGGIGGANPEAGQEPNHDSLTNDEDRPGADPIVEAVSPSPQVAEFQPPPVEPDAVPPAGDQADPEREADPFDIAAAIIARIAEGRDEPIEVPFAESGEPIDWHQALSLPIAAFEQRNPVPAHKLLRLIEEMAVISIDATALPQQERARLEQPVRLSAGPTTAGDILAEVLRQAGLSHVKEADRLRLIPAPPDG